MVNKQIKEMVSLSCPHYDDGNCTCNAHQFGVRKCDGNCSYGRSAVVLYYAGYRKQIEGEWKPQFEGSSLLICTNCGYEYHDRLECTNFCGNCGAKMKGR